jgi:DNA (cytosine-5)-methyltransferase 1
LGIFQFFCVWEAFGISSFPEATKMAPQLHVRLSDSVHENLVRYATVAGETKQNCIVQALGLLFGETAIARREGVAKFKFVDLFAGIGGMRIAFESSGCECVFSSEWDKYCRQTYFENFGAMPHGDITKINVRDVPDHDILAAGFPCQPFSIAGVSKKASLGLATGFLDKAQGTLFFNVAEIIGAKRPKAFLLENVKNLKSHDKGKTWKVITDVLDKLGYEVFPNVMDGQLFCPQHRERIFIVGFDRTRHGCGIGFDFSIAAPPKKAKIKDILENKVDKKYTLTDHLWRYLQNYAAKHQSKGNGFGYGLTDLDGVARTLSARYYKDGSEILIPQKGKNPRRLTPRECARLQGYGDDFKIPVSDTQAYKQFGNSVVVPLVSAIAKKIVSVLEQANTSGFSDMNCG